MTRFETVAEKWSWKPIPNCPGRFQIPKTTTPPAMIAGLKVEPEKYQSKRAPDPILIIRFPDGGGLISYAHSDGYVHTLNTREGFARKLADLAIQ